MSTEDFYLRYYVGHKGKFGHEFLEFEFRPDGKLRYANNSNYKNDTMIRKEAFVHQSVMEELKRIIIDSEIMQEDDLPWPPPDRVGRQVGFAAVHSSGGNLTNHASVLGTGDRHRGRAHLVHHFQNWILGGRQPVEGPRGTEVLLLPGAGSQVPGLLTHRPALQDQTHISHVFHLKHSLFIKRIVFCNGTSTILVLVLAITSYFCVQFTVNKK